MKIDLVPFDPCYADAIADIEKGSFSDPWSREAFISSATSPLTDITVALSYEGSVPSVCGYSVTVSVPPECEILNIAVAKDQRRKGIAELLMKDIAERASKRGCDTLMLEVRESNLAARALYEKIGFEAVGIRKAYYRYPTEDAILMDRRI
jgi:ribosomal-protein-alanine N-acetyltransferase